jgi:hypothetical protein
MTSLEKSMEVDMTKTMILTKSMIALGTVATALAAFGAGAQPMPRTDDDIYCQALAARYETYLDNWGRQGLPPQSAEARVSAEKCKAHDTGGIPGLEKALRNARIDLPSRT